MFSQSTQVNKMKGKKQMNLDAQNFLDPNPPENFQKKKYSSAPQTPKQVETKKSLLQFQKF